MMISETKMPDTTMLTEEARSLHIFNAPAEPLSFYEKLKYDKEMRSSFILKMEQSPYLSRVEESKKEDLFIEKLRFCYILFDFDKSEEDFRGKEAKLNVLKECVEYIVGPRQTPFSEQVYPEIFNMFAFNVLRTLPPHVNPTGPAFDPEEDEPVLNNAWSHLQYVYEIFIRFFDSSDMNSQMAKKYISTAFVTYLLQLFDNEDPRERDLLKTSLHRIYGKFLHLRSFIRKSIGNIFLEFIYEKEKHMGIAELLEILGSIINGFAVPLKDEHKTFLEKILIPLHRPRSYSIYYPQLTYCVSQYCMKEKELREVMLLKLCKIWPVLSSSKQVLFLSEVEELVDSMDQETFDHIKFPLINQLSFCISSQQFQVAERALYFWNNFNFVTLLIPNLEELFPQIFPVLFMFCKKHWNTAIHGLAMNALKVMMDSDPKAFQSFVDSYMRQFTQLKKEMGGEIMDEEQERHFMWEFMQDQATEKTIKSETRVKSSVRNSSDLSSEDKQKRALHRKSMLQRQKRLSYHADSGGENVFSIDEEVESRVPDRPVSLTSSVEPRKARPATGVVDLSPEAMKEFRQTLKLKRKSSLPMDQAIFDELAKHAQPSPSPQPQPMIVSAEARLSDVSITDDDDIDMVSEHSAVETASKEVPVTPPMPSPAPVEKPSVSDQPSEPLTPSGSLKHKNGSEKETSLSALKNALKAKLLPRPSKKGK